MEKKIDIVYQDDNLLVLNKPAGWVVSKERVGEKNPTIEEWLKGKVEKGLWRNGVAHRLDKGTSGLLVVAKNERSLRDLMRQFRQRRVKKKYWAMLGADVSAEGVIEAPIGRSGFGRFGVKVGGKQARSEFRVVDKYKKEGKVYSLVEVDLKTGRTHQIRVHFSYLGWPLLGDFLYGGEKMGMDRFFLHAFRLEFDSLGGERLRFVLDMPEDLTAVLDKYEKI